MDAYAREFRTVEVNNTFYRWPTEAVFATWYDRLPEGFLLSAKASRGLTQFRKLNDPQPWLDRMEAGLVHLREKRGVLLFNSHPTSHATLTGSIDSWRRCLRASVRP